MIGISPLLVISLITILSLLNKVNASTTLHLCDPATNQLSKLSIQGANVVNDFNQTVYLRGVNVGGWLVFENWMCGINSDPISSGRYPHKTLLRRFNTQSAYTLLNTWYDNFLTGLDLDILASYQFNYIRVPFAYYNFMNENGEWISGNGTVNNPQVPDFSRLDWIVDQAAKRGLYTVLCFHIWWGQDGNFNGTISTNSNPYSDISNNPSNPLSAAEQKSASILLQAISAHFKGNTNVAAIDLINEPSGSYSPYTGYIHDVLYKAVRAGDSSRLVVACWVTPSSVSQLGWTGVIYEAHDYSGYQTGNSTIDKQHWYSFLNDPNGPFVSAKQAGLKVPFLIGEFQGDSEVLDFLISSYNANNFHWSMWTYKGVNIGGWALINYYNNIVNVNITGDSYQSILNSWSRLSKWFNNPSSMVYYKSNIQNVLSQYATPKIDTTVTNSPSLWNRTLDPNCQPGSSNNNKPNEGYRHGLSMYVTLVLFTILSFVLYC